MPLVLPSQALLSNVFSPQSPYGHSMKRDAPQNGSASSALSDLYPAWSAVDDIKHKAEHLSEEAQREIQKASQLAQAKAGKIELYSPKYYAACTLGGLMACVSRPIDLCLPQLMTIGCHTYGSDSIGLGEMSPSSRFEDVQGKFRGVG